MELLEALLNLSSVSGKRSLQRIHLYGAVKRVTVHLTDVLRINDSVTVGERVYALRRFETTDGNTVYVMTVNNGRGQAILGERIHVKPFVPHASYEEHVIFAEKAKDIIDAFGELLRADVHRSETAENEAITESQYVDRII